MPDFIDLLQRNKTAKLLRYFRSGLVIDTEPLIIYLIGAYDTQRGSDYLNTFNYKRKDFIILEKFLKLMNVKILVVTPHILTEICYWIRAKIRPPDLQDFINQMLPFLKRLEEEPADKDYIIEIPKFKRDFEITDCSIIVSCSENGYNSILTDDKELADICKQDQRILTIHFTEDIKGYYYTIAR